MFRVPVAASQSGVQKGGFGAGRSNLIIGKCKFAEPVFRFEILVNTVPLFIYCGPFERHKPL